MGFHLPACKSSEPHADADKWREMLARARDVRRAAVRMQRRMDDAERLRGKSVRTEPFTVDGQGN